MGRSNRPLGVLPVGSERMMRGAARSLLVTPWFALGAGFVIAAGLWLYSPHAVLRFPLAAPETVPCTAPGCTGGGQPATSASGKLLNSTPDRFQPGINWRHRADRGPTFGFTVLWQHHRRFGALITFPGRHVPDNWNLSFLMRGDQITYVFGAAWTPSPSGSGGTATPDSHWQSDNGDGYGTTFMITGRGRAHLPTECVFDGAGCSFTRADPPQRLQD